MKTNDRVRARPGTQLALIVGESTLGWVHRNDGNSRRVTVLWDSKHTTWDPENELELVPHTTQELRDFKHAQHLIWEHCETFTRGRWTAMPAINPYLDSFGCSSRCPVHGDVPWQNAIDQTAHARGQQL